MIDINSELKMLRDLHYKSDYDLIKAKVRGMDPAIASQICRKLRFSAITNEDLAHTIRLYNGNN